jgi:hypothetical protein
MDASRFVFLDETGTATNMTRRYGRAPRGQRVVDAVPHGHWLTTTFVAGLRESGVIAPLVVDGPMKGEIFRAYVEQMLASSSFPSSRRSCAKQAHAPRKRSGPPSENCSTRSRPRSAGTTSGTADMSPSKSKPL